jgi:hypothetical protein
LAGFFATAAPTLINLHDDGIMHSWQTFPFEPLQPRKLRYYGMTDFFHSLRALGPFGTAVSQKQKKTANTNFFRSISDRTHTQTALKYRNYNLFPVLVVQAGLHSEILYYLCVPKFARFKAGIGTEQKIK